MLETEIKRLSDNIQHLNKLLEAMAEMAKSPEVTTKPAPKVEVAPKPTPKVEVAPKPAPTPEVEIKAEPAPEVENERGYSVDDIKSLALAISRKDRSKQKDIKAKLAEHDARVAADLKGDGIQAVGEWITALKEEIGA